MDQFKDVIIKNVIPSLAFIEEIESVSKYRIESRFPLLNGSIAETYLQDGLFTLGFNTIRPLSQDERNAMWDSHIAFICKNDTKNLIFDFTSFAGYSIPLMKDPARYECGIRKYHNMEVAERKHQYFRAVVPTKDAQKPGGIFEGSKVKVDQTTYIAGLISILFGDHSFHLFAQTSKDKKRHFLFVECLERTDYQTFVKNVDIILLSYAFVAGYYPRDKRYILSSQDSAFSEIRGISFETLQKSFSSNYSVVPSSALRIHFGLPREIEFPLVSFNHLCQQLISNDALAQSILLLVEGHILSLELRAAVYSIALEAITDIICRENESKFVPIPSKSLAKKVFQALRSTLDSCSSEISPEGIDTLKKKLNVINSPTNKEKLLKPFSLMQVKLDPNEIDCIDKRNDFLHGRFPFRVTDSNDKFRIEQITLTLLYCVTVLLLKYIGYSGFVTYYPAFNQYKQHQQITTYFVKRI